MTDITLEELLEKQKVETSDTQLRVQMPDQKLDVGAHRFSLTVVDDSGNVSVPATITVLVVDTKAPTAVLNVADESGRTLVDRRIEFGAGFILTSKGSVDVGGGTIASYVWEVLPD